MQGNWFCFVWSIHFNSVCEMFLNLAVWRHVDKTGPEGHIDAMLMYGQGKHVVKSVCVCVLWNWALKWFLSLRCCCCCRKWPSASLLGDHSRWFEVGGSAWYWKVVYCVCFIVTVLGLTDTSNWVSSFDHSFQAAALIGVQDFVKYVAVLKKSAISLHDLSSGSQIWVENLPDRWWEILKQHFFLLQLLMIILIAVKIIC